MPNSDDFLMQQFLSGDQGAFSILVNRYKLDIFRFILGKVKNREQASDLTQEVFIKLFKAAKNYASRGKFKAWLYCLAQNLCIDEYRKRQKVSIFALHRAANSVTETNPRQFDQLVDEENNPMQEVESFELQETLNMALELIPDNQKTALILCQYQGMSYAEIAEIQNCPVGTVKSRIHNALRKVKEILKEKGIIEGC